jgi:hypothetical protein
VFVCVYVNVSLFEFNDYHLKLLLKFLKYKFIAGQTNAVIHLMVKPKSRDLMSSEEVLRSGNAVHQRQGAHLSSAPVNSGENYRRPWIFQLYEVYLPVELRMIICRF